MPETLIISMKRKKKGTILIVVGLVIAAAAVTSMLGYIAPVYPSGPVPNTTMNFNLINISVLIVGIVLMLIGYLFSRK